jgi:TonB family protein
MSDGFRIVILGEGSQEFRTGKATIGFGSGAASVEGDYISGRLLKTSQAITSVDLKRSDLEPMKKTRMLSIVAKNAAEKTFALDLVELALKSLDRCVVDLLKGWGMDEALQQSIATPPKAKNLLRAVKDRDYPAAAIRRGEQGATGIRLMVGADGSLRDCHVVESSGSTILDQTTCEIILKRAKFEPALDRSGTPVPSLTFTRVQWALPSS